MVVVVKHCVAVVTQTVVVLDAIVLLVDHSVDVFIAVTITVGLLW